MNYRTVSPSPRTGGKSHHFVRVVTADYTLAQKMTAYVTSHTISDFGVSKLNHSRISHERNLDGSDVA